MPKQISILRIDTNFYSSTEVALNMLFDRIEDRGYLIIDDYFNYGGQKDATRAFFARRGLLEELDYSVRRRMEAMYNTMMPRLFCIKGTHWRDLDGTRKNLRLFGAKKKKKKGTGGGPQV
eukprot:TRINITY_DN20829_c0_g1_i1.p1 TRINITY_DN20829_c0_g1~~TRINITY_DN20829_c0_g1_i1.p1  ORF type:complete len:120 (-),score=13.57 TRINITY_DN20829_c0_g1_i1:20-379(-)